MGQPLPSEPERAAKWQLSRLPLPPHGRFGFKITKFRAKIIHSPNRKPTKVYFAGAAASCWLAKQDHFDFSLEFRGDDERGRALAMLVAGAEKAEVMIDLVAAHLRKKPKRSTAKYLVKLNRHVAKLWSACEQLLAKRYNSREFRVRCYCEWMRLAHEHIAALRHFYPKLARFFPPRPGRLPDEERVRYLMVFAECLAICAHKDLDDEKKERLAQLLFRAKVLRERDKIYALWEDPAKRVYQRGLRGVSFEEIEGAAYCDFVAALESLRLVGNKNNQSLFDYLLGRASHMRAKLRQQRPALRPRLNQGGRLAGTGETDDERKVRRILERLEDERDWRALREMDGDPADGTRGAKRQIAILRAYGCADENGLPGMVCGEEPQPLALSEPNPLDDLSEEEKRRAVLNLASGLGDRRSRRNAELYLKCAVENPGASLAELGRRTGFHKSYVCRLRKKLLHRLLRWKTVREISRPALGWALLSRPGTEVVVRRVSSLKGGGNYCTKQLVDATRFTMFNWERWARLHREKQLDAPDLVEREKWERDGEGRIRRCQHGTYDPGGEGWGCEMCRKRRS